VGMWFDSSVSFNSSVSRDRWKHEVTRSTERSLSPLSQSPSVTWLLDPQAFGGHSDLGNGPTPGSYNFCHGDGCRSNLPMTTQIGQPIPSPNSSFGGSPPFAGGTGSALAEQSYPSVHQFTASPNEQVWMLDFNHINPSYGSGPEVASSVGAVTYNLVGGTTGVYRFTSVNGGVSYKQIPLLSWAGYHLLRDVSSPSTGNIITDSTPWNFCYVGAVGECRSGSAVGEVYATVPQATAYTQCVSNQYDNNYPCVATPYVRVAFGIQQGISQNDPAGQHWRPITQGFSGPGRQYQFASFIPDPTGAWAFMQGFWLDGTRNELLITHLPPWPYDQDVTTNRSTFVPTAVSLGRSSELDQARVRFGYAENGSPANFYCTARQENCSTTTNSSMPFAFESEGPVWQVCSSGCTIQIPALPGRVLYYAVDRKSSSSGRVQLGDMKVAANP
jgi:hypothetical protein